MKQSNNDLRVKYSNFKTSMDFNEWAQKFQVSTLAPHVVEPYEKKLDNYNYEEKCKMISSVMKLDIKPSKLEKKRVI